MRRLDHNGGSASFKVRQEPYQGVARTVEVMRQLASDGQAHPKVRRWAEQVVQQITPKDHLSEAAAVYYAACRQVRYTRDPANVEYLQHPSLVLENRHGDCDDLGVLLAAALASVGNDMQFVTVGFKKNGQYTHVFLQMRDPRSGRMVVLDPVAGPYVGQMLGKVRRHQTYWASGGR